MGLFSSIKRHAVGIASEMFMFRDPYDRPTKPQIIHEECDRHGNVVTQIVRASSAREAARHLQGTTIQGDRSVVVTHMTDVRRGLYDVHTEAWDKDGKGMKRVYEYDSNAWSETYQEWLDRERGA